MKITKKQFITLIVIGFIIRISFSSISFHPGDTFIWNKIFQDIFIYNQSPLIWFAQGPINFFIIFFTGFFTNLFSIENFYLTNISRHLIFILGDISIFILSYRICKNYFFENRYLFSLLIWLNPLLIFISSIHGQTEQWMLFFSLLSIYLISIRSLQKGYISAGLSIATKYLFIIFLPFIWIQKRLSIKEFIRAFFYISTTYLILLGILNIINIFFYQDYNFFNYFVERLGIIKGNFVPEFSTNLFVATGMSIWGIINQTQIISRENFYIIEYLRNNWFIIYLMFYGYIIVSYYKKKIQNKKSVKLSNKEVFIELVSIYIIVFSVFLFLFPMTVGHRFINLLPLMFLIFNSDSKKIVEIGMYYFSFLTLGVVIYGKNGFFVGVESSNIFIGAILILILILPYHLLSTQKHNLLESTTYIISIPILFFLMNGPYYHSRIMFVSYIILFLTIYGLHLGKKKLS